MQRLYYKLPHRCTIKSRCAALFSLFAWSIKARWLQSFFPLLTVVANMDDREAFNCESFCFLQVDRIIFCVFLEVDYKIFKKKMGEFFPLGRYSNQVPSDFKKKKKCRKNAGVGIFSSFQSQILKCELSLKISCTLRL